jgi:hypothetical protein
MLVAGLVDGADLVFVGHGGIAFMFHFYTSEEALSLTIV